ncbi:hypothetical protein Tco_0527645 [Tanacetum coccineum]
MFLRKLKGKEIVDNATQLLKATTIAPGLYKLDPVTLPPKVVPNCFAGIWTPDAMAQAYDRRSLSTHQFHSQVSEYCQVRTQSFLRWPIPGDSDLESDSVQDSFKNPKLSPAPFVPPSGRMDLVFYLVFDEFFSTPASVASPVPAMEAPAPVVSTGTPSSTTVDQDAFSYRVLSIHYHNKQSKKSLISDEEESYDLEVAHICNDSCFGIPSQATAPKESSKTTQFNDDPLQETLHEESTS